MLVSVFSLYSIYVIFLKILFNNLLQKTLPNNSIRNIIFSLYNYIEIYMTFYIPGFSVTLLFSIA